MSDWPTNITPRAHQQLIQGVKNGGGSVMVLRKSWMRTSNISLVLFI